MEAKTRRSMRNLVDVLDASSRNSSSVWSDLGRDAQAAREWTDRFSKLARLDRFDLDADAGALMFAEYFDDPDVAGEWAGTSLVEFAERGDWVSWSKYAWMMTEVGVQPAVLAEWSQAVTDVPFTEVAALASAAAGSLELARLAVAHDMSWVEVNIAVKACGVDDASRWVTELRITDGGRIRDFAARGITVDDVVEARRSGRGEVTVACGGEEHVVAVSWKNGRVRWLTPNHDRNVEAAAEAFGAEQSTCAAYVHNAKNVWRKGNGTAIPAGALRWFKNPDAGEPDRYALEYPDNTT